MKEIVFGIWLGTQSGLDFKYKEISLWASLGGAILGILFCIIERRSVVDIIVACIPGTVCLLFSWATKEVIGYGDGIVLIVMATYFPLSNILSIGMLSLGLAGVVALILLVIFHKNGSYRIPFIPFLGLAYVMEYLIAQGGVLV